EKISKRPNFWGLFLSFSEVGFLFLGEKRGSVHSQLLSENDKSPQTAKTCRSASFEISDFHTWRKTA
ncbi:hypothetical protein, partial [Acinetobacter pittii]|uniref:hypothetical protein n=1 Tax=Acinetobacter pittii TaxID=48296 RepID=UPI001FF0EA8E